jgi:uncharacterized protein YndB with AHSA1/START domain
MSRTDVVSRVIQADVQRVFAALVDEAALAEWLPPNGMTGHFEHFDARPGGSYRLVLTYGDGSAGKGKSTSESDVVEVRFLEVVPNVRVAQAVDFVSDDPAFAGTMTMTWELSPADDRTHVTIRADNVPPGISPEDHEVGMDTSLAQLETFLRKPELRAEQL